MRSASRPPKDEIATLVDGQIQSVPPVRTQIPTGAVQLSRLTPDRANQIAAALNANA